MYSYSPMLYFGFAFLRWARACQARGPQERLPKAIIVVMSNINTFIQCNCLIECFSFINYGRLIHGGWRGKVNYQERHPVECRSPRDLKYNHTFHL